MEILIQDLQKKIPIRRPRIKRALKTLLHEKGIGSGHLSVVFVTPQKMRVLNMRYMRHSYSTDVLTFDFLNAQHSSKRIKHLQAEIIVAPAVAAQNALVYQTSTEDEIILYLVHGVLHLLGFDDHRKGEILRMRREEKRLLVILRRSEAKPKNLKNEILRHKRRSG